MTDDPVKVVTHQRVKELLDCYGGSSQAWPEQERAAAWALLESSTELQRLREEALLLDQALNLPRRAGMATTTAATADLARKILGQLPEAGLTRQPNQTDRHISRPDQHRALSWATLLNWSWVWAGVAVGAAAAVALVITLLPPQPVIDRQVRVTTAANDFEDWVWEEVLDQTPEDPISRSDSDLVTLLEPELVPDDF
jgi:hypothetical protein